MVLKRRAPLFFQYVVGYWRNSHQSPHWFISNSQYFTFNSQDLSVNELLELLPANQTPEAQCSAWPLMRRIMKMHMSSGRRFDQNHANLRRLQKWTHAIWQDTCGYLRARESSRRLYSFLPAASSRLDSRLPDPSSVR